MKTLKPRGIKEASDDFKKKQEELLSEFKKIDIVICTALIPEKSTINN